MKWWKKLQNLLFVLLWEKKEKKTSCENSPQRKIMHATLVLL
jgi:hypothetical protein